MQKLWERYFVYFKGVLVTLIIVALIIAILIGLKLINSSSETYDRILWRQSVETTLENKIEAWNSEIYKKVSESQGDLTNYQYNTNQRLRSLENRMDRLEKTLQANTNVQINNSNTNYQGGDNSVR